ncbi:MAG: protein kinase [Planctomycetes bacterium]|nr:protein kinase [Planctomycetota bacterium]MCB9936315.1 protein kinase [Planctomycetota bacterium]
MQTLLSVTPSSAQAEIVAEVESLAAQPLAESLASLGVDAQAQSTLFSLKPDTSSEAATRALSSIADRRERVAEMTRRLPAASASGRYQVKKEFARGGMGVIWVALDTAVGREVALKELLPPQAGRGTSHVSDTPELVERFLREAKVTGQLEHPNIVPVYEIAAREDGSVFYTMKLVRGRTMAHRLLQIQHSEASPQQKLAERLKLLDAFTDVCNAVAYAHSRGVIHRDLKPANIMLGDFGETMVLDWGLARVQGQEDSSTIKRRADERVFSPSLMQEDPDNRTLDGAILGTPAYMPPEQARGELDKLDERADVYALGAILYELLSGRPPYQGGTARDVLAKVLVLEPDPLPPEAPPDLVSLANKAMAREPAQRLESAEKLAAEVLAFRDGRELSVYRYSSRELLKRFVRRHKAAVSVAAVALLLGVAGGVYAFNRVMGERDQARINLQSAEREREARIATELKQQQERDKLIETRQQDITAQRRRLDGLQASNLTSEATTRITELKARGAVDGALAPADRAENARIVSGLLAVAAAQADLIRLETAPVAGRSHEFVPAEVLEADRTVLRTTRLRAAELALLNDDFALAEFIVEGTETAERAEWLGRIEAGRSALLARHRQKIEEALDDVRQGLARLDRPRGSIRLEDYVIQLSAYRETQTVELLAEALRPFVERARTHGDNAFWNQAERDEIVLICRTLGYLELPDLTVAVLAAFMAEIEDVRLAIECGTALCLTSSAAAYAPLSKARERFKPDSYVWRRISRWFSRVPEPADLPQPATAGELVERAVIRSERNDREGALRDVEAALQLESENVKAMVYKARNLSPKDAIPVCERALQIDPSYDKTYVVLGNGYYQTGQIQKAIEATLKAIELNADSATHHINAGFYLQRDGQSDAALEHYNIAARLEPMEALVYTNRAALYLGRKMYDEAAADLSRAIDLDPLRVEAWLNRGIARFETGDTFGALEDVNRALEVLPGYAWGVNFRSMVYRRMERNQEALDDLNYLLPGWAHVFTDAYRRRGDVRLTLKDEAGALQDYRKYLENQPDAEDRAEVEALVAELE